MISHDEFEKQGDTVLMIGSGGEIMLKEATRLSKNIKNNDWHKRLRLTVCISHCFVDICALNNLDITRK